MLQDADMLTKALTTNMHLKAVARLGLQLEEKDKTKTKT